jgi:CubicO group peptidase (beta-lactamase class C family)
MRHIRLVRHAAAAPPPALGVASLHARPPRFTDARRPQKLAAAFGDIDVAFRSAAADAHVPGAAWGILIDGRLAHVGLTGVRNVASGAPVGPGTAFRVGSMTKSVTAMAILRLRDEGCLELDDPAEHWVPELRGLRYPTSDSPRVTIRHLLSHAAGFPEDDPWGDRQLGLDGTAFSALLQRGVPFSHAPGVAYAYSNLAFMLLGRVVARASGTRYEDYVAAHLLRPLGMSASTFSPGAVPAEHLALGYRWEDDDWTPEPQPAGGAGAAMGGLFSSVLDLGAYVGLFLGAWPPRDGADDGPVCRASLREMQQIVRPGRLELSPATGETSRASFGGYGYGLEVASTGDFARVVGHGGGLPGFGSLMRWLPEYGVGLVVLGNGTYADWNEAADRTFVLLAETGALQPRAPVPSAALVSLHEAVSRLVLHWDDRLADSVAAPNLFLDRSRARRRAEIARLVAQVGPCRAVGGFDAVDGALSGAWVLPCERGALRVAITLAPTVPATVQSLEVTAIARPGRGLAARAP